MSERKVVDYLLLSNLSVDALSNLVQEAVKLDWQLLGLPFEYRGELCQAMVRYEEASQQQRFLQQYGAQPPAPARCAYCSMDLVGMSAVEQHAHVNTCGSKQP